MNSGYQGGNEYLSPVCNSCGSVASHLQIPSISIQEALKHHSARIEFEETEIKHKNGIIYALDCMKSEQKRLISTDICVPRAQVNTLIKKWTCQTANSKPIYLLKSAAIWLWASVNTVFFMSWQSVSKVQMKVSFSIMMLPLLICPLTPYVQC